MTHGLYNGISSQTVVALLSSYQHYASIVSCMCGRRAASRLSNASGAAAAAGHTLGPEGLADSAFERPAPHRKPSRRLSWADEHEVGWD